VAASILSYQLSNYYYLVLLLKCTDYSDALMKMLQGHFIQTGKCVKDVDVDMRMVTLMAQINNKNTNAEVLTFTHHHHHHHHHLDLLWHCSPITRASYNNYTLHKTESTSFTNTTNTNVPLIASKVCHVFEYG